jgi:tetratricopeptide (TPR) repeat protein
LLGVSARFALLVNMGLVEGLAEAVTPERGELDLHTWARAMRDLGIAPDLRKILGPAGFWSEPPRRAYTIAGSFIRYLLETHGARRLRQVYAHGDFEAAYGQPLGRLLDGWQRLLDDVALSASERRIAAERFNRGSIFSRPCAHEVAQLRARAAKADPRQEVILRRQICAYLGEDATAAIELAHALRKAGDSEGFLALSDNLLEVGRLNGVQRGELLAARGEVLWARGDLDAARKRFADVAHLHLGQASDRLQWVRLWALDGPETLRALMLRFLSGASPPLAAVVGLLEQLNERSGDRTIAYLVGRQLHRVGAWAMALDYLQRAADHPFGPIERERLRLEADAFWQLRRYGEAADRYRSYQDHSVLSGDRARAADWLARIAWTAQARAATESPQR